MPPGRGEDLQLSDKEKSEFDNITYDAIQSLTDLNKLRKLEAYLRQEGFETTATCVRERLKALGNPVLLPNDPEIRRAEAEAAKTAREEMAAFLAQVKRRDEALSAAGGKSTSAHDRAPVRTPVEADSTDVAAATVSAPKPRSDATVGGQVRSGKDYYSKWDRVAESALQEDEKDDTQGGAELEAPAIVQSVEKLSAANAGLSPAEREVLALREKEKGNDLFRAREYASAVAAYSLSLELWPASAVVLANRAAVHMKLKQWAQAEADCDAALASEPGYLKALLRRAAARVELGNMEGAQADAEEGLKADPSSKELLKIQGQCEKALEKKSMKRLAIEEVSDGEESEDEETEIANETAAALPTHSRGGFLACPKWGGPLPGYYFGTGDQGTGYYPDPLANPPLASTPPPPTISPQPSQCVEAKHTEIECNSGAEMEEDDSGAKLPAMEVEPEESSLQVQADSLRASGNEAFAKGEYLTAADTFSRALRFTPDCPVLLNNRAACRLKMGEADVAELDAGTAVALDPSYGKAWNRLGVCRKTLGKLEGAAEAFSKALAHVPVSAKRGIEKELVEVRKLIASRKKRREGRATTAFGADSTEYKKGAVVIEELDSDDDSEEEDVSSGGGQGMNEEFKVQAHGRREKAKQAAEEWEARRRDREQRLSQAEALRQKQGLATQKKGMVQFKQSNETGTDMTEKATALPSSTATPVKPLKQADAVGVDGTCNETKATSQVIAPPDKKNVDFNASGMGSVGEMTGKGEGEERRVEDLRLAGNAAFKAGEMSHAKQLWEAALDVDPNNVAVLSNRAMLHLKTKDFNACLKDCEAVLRLEPGHAKALHRRALARRQLGELDAACADYRGLLMKLPGNKQATAEYRALLEEIKCNVKKANNQVSEEAKKDTVDEVTGDGKGIANGVMKGTEVPKTGSMEVMQDVKDKLCEGDGKTTEDDVSGVPKNVKGDTEGIVDMEENCSASAMEGEGHQVGSTADGPDTPPLTPPSDKPAVTRRKIVVEESDEEEDVNTAEGVTTEAAEGSLEAAETGRTIMAEKGSKADENSGEAIPHSGTSVEAVGLNSEETVVRKRIVVESEDDDEEEEEEVCLASSVAPNRNVEAADNRRKIVDERKDGGEECEKSLPHSKSSTEAGSAATVMRKRIVVESDDDDDDDDEKVVVASSEAPDTSRQATSTRRKIVVEESDEDEEPVEELPRSTAAAAMDVRDPDVAGVRRKIAIEESDDEAEAARGTSSVVKGQGDAPAIQTHAMRENDGGGEKDDVADQGSKKGTSAAATAEQDAEGKEGSRKRIVVEESDEEDGANSPTASASNADAAEHIKRPNAAELKEIGNARFKAGELKAAVEAYSAALEVEPDNAVLYANRAMALLKDGQFGQAEADCDAALQRDPGYVKARHRRAAARRKLGRLEAAADDFAAVRAALPKNKALAEEAAECERALAAHKAADAKKKIPIVDDENNMENSQSLKEQSTPERMDISSEPAAKASTKTGDRLHAAAAAKAAAAIRLHETHQQLPPPPKSAVDFERTAKLYAKDPEQLASYVRQLSPDELPRVFKASLTPGIVADYATAIVHGGMLPDDAPLAAALLRGLTGCDRFAMNVMLMGKPGKVAVREAVEGIEAAGVDTAELRKFYKV